MKFKTGDKIIKFKSGDRVRIKDSVSINGRYGSYRGLEGNIQNVSLTSGNILLDNGDYLPDVGLNVIDKISNNKKPNEKKLISILDDEINSMIKEVRYIEEKIHSAKVKQEFLQIYDLNVLDMDMFHVYQVVLALYEHGVVESEESAIYSDTDVLPMYEDLEEISKRIFKDKDYYSNK